MGQHIPIKCFKDEKWYEPLNKTVKYWVKKFKHSAKSTDDFIRLNKRISILPLKYKYEYEDTTKILSYRSPLKISLDNDNPKLKICSCTFEIHIKDNDIQEIYIVV